MKNRMLTGVGSVVSIRTKSKVQIEEIEDAEVIAAVRDKRDAHLKKVAMAREILAEKAVPDSVVKKDSLKFSREANFVTTIFSFLVAAMLVTWYLWEDSFLDNEEDLIYNLGLVGGIMMLLQFVYSARKRSKRMRPWGPLKNWFSVHTFIGLTAPLIIIIHSRFELLSINGTVAFIAMLIVVFSGIVGRYLFSQVNFDLAEGRAQLKELHTHVQKNILQPNQIVASDLEKYLKTFMVQAFATPKNFIQSFHLAIRIGLKAQTLYLRICQLSVSQATAGEGHQQVGKISLLGAEEKRLLKNYLNLMAKIARCNAYKNLFSMWRVGHVPLIYLLLITGIAHVVAVHMY